MSDFWKFFTGFSVAVVVYAVSYVWNKFSGGNILVAGLLASGFAAIAFWGAGHFLGYSHPDELKT